MKVKEGYIVQHYMMRIQFNHIRHLSIDINIFHILIAELNYLCTFTNRNIIDKDSIILRNNIAKLLIPVIHISAYLILKSVLTDTLAYLLKRPLRRGDYQTSLRIIYLEIYPVTAINAELDKL